MIVCPDGQIFPFLPLFYTFQPLFSASTQPCTVFFFIFTQPDGSSQQIEEKKIAVRRKKNGKQMKRETRRGGLWLFRDPEGAVKIPVKRERATAVATIQVSAIN